jgi:2-aminoadipate transaminase
VIVERPSYLAALQTFSLAEARFETIDGDEQGARIDQLEAALARAKAAGRPAKLVYLVANFANPSGATLSRERRIQLARTAAAHRVFVVEDDPYGELRSFGEAVPPLVALAADVPGAPAWCGYLSTLSKILAPGLRIGWLVLPPRLHEQVVICKQGMDLHTSTLTQEIAARYLASGRLGARIPTIRSAYRERNEALAAALERHLQGRIRYNRPDGGMFLWARLTDELDTMQVLQAAIDEGMIFVPGAPFYAAAPDHATLRLSFATPTPAALDEGAQRLARAIERTAKERRSAA